MLKISLKVVDIMDQQSFFTLNSINYYFEIHSDWARGNKEMMMISIILDQQISTEVEEMLSSLLSEFSEKLQSNKEIFRAFYINDRDKFNEIDKEKIAKNDSILKAMIEKLFIQIIEEHEIDVDLETLVVDLIEKSDIAPYCKHCGATLAKGASFCHMCGNKVD